MRKTPGFRVEWAATARSDLEAIVRYIAEDNIEAALTTLGDLERSTATLKSVPLRGRVVPELAAFGIRTYRELVHPPWRIVYRVSGRTIEVLAVVDSRRNLEDLLLERLIRGSSPA